LYNKLFPTWRGPRRAVLPGLSCPRPADGPGRWRWHEDADSKVATAPLQATEMDGVRAGRRHAKWWVTAVAARCRTDATLMVLSGCFARAPCHLDIATARQSHLSALAGHAVHSFHAKRSAVWPDLADLLPVLRRSQCRSMPPDGKASTSIYSSPRFRTLTHCTRRAL